MNGTAVRSGMLNKIVAWFRSGYPQDAPQFGHVAVVALCPEAASVLRRSASRRFEGDPRA
jgi:hypothetical protein